MYTLEKLDFALRKDLMMGQTRTRTLLCIDGSSFLEHIFATLTSNSEHFTPFVFEIPHHWCLQHVGA